MFSWNMITSCTGSHFGRKMPNTYFFRFCCLILFSLLFLLYSSSCMHNEIHFSLILFRKFSGRTDCFWRVCVDFILANMLYWTPLCKERCSSDSNTVMHFQNLGMRDTALKSVWMKLSVASMDQPVFSIRSETVNKDARCFSNANLCFLGAGLHQFMWLQVRHEIIKGGNNSLLSLLVWAE